MLEKWYWVAGIVVAIAAVIALFVKSKSAKNIKSEQNANVSGQHNAVNQNSSIENKGPDEV